MGKLKKLLKGRIKYIGGASGSRIGSWLGARVGIATKGIGISGSIPGAIILGTIGFLAGHIFDLKRKIKEQQRTYMRRYAILCLLVILTIFYWVF